jgi:hypothetical protein
LNQVLRSELVGMVSEHNEISTACSIDRWKTGPAASRH